MKIIKILIVAAVCLVFTGCKEYGEKRIVNLITVNSDKIAVYYYDFSKEEVTYLKEEKVNTGIKNTLVSMLSEADYDLKLCRYAVVSDEIIHNKIKELYFALTDNRFAPDIIILEGKTNLEPEEYKKTDEYAYPLYNYSVKNNMISCAVEKLDNNEKSIVIDNSFYRLLNRQQSFAFDILSRTKKQGTYVWENNETELSAELDKINTFYSVENRTLYINITAVIKSYKGMQAGSEYKKIIKDLIEKDICNNVTEMLEDKIMTNKFNLLLYEKSEHYDKINVNVNVF